MTCTGCGVQVPGEFAFCPRCGRHLGVTCRACGAACPRDSSFCPRCGARLTAAVAPAPPNAAATSSAVENNLEPHADSSALPGSFDEGPRGRGSAISTRAPESLGEADRRMVTVLFADVAGFTALAERLDPEEVRAFQADLLAELAPPVERYGGFLEKFVGDAVMAVFGAPIAHEDDAERALRTALVMRERAAVLDERWGPRLGQRVALHIGVDTGDVVAGDLGGASGEAYAVTGDAVNTAARLQSLAAPGEILASAATCRLAAHAVVVEPVGPLKLKGKVASVSAFRVLGLQATPPRARGLEAQGLVAPLVGRGRELARMRGARARMERGRAQVLHVVGEAGIGKSRLVGEFLARVIADGSPLTVRRAVCSALGEHPYGVLAAFIREGYGVAPGDPLSVAREKLTAGLQDLGADPDETQRLAALLGYILGLEGDTALPDVEPEQLKRQIFRAVRTLLERRLEQSPVLLVVEDLHWADGASVALLRDLLGRLADRRLMLIATYRPTFDATALTTARAAHAILRLATFTVPESEQLLAELFGSSWATLPADLRTLMVTRGGGNPFYLEELIRHLLAEGVLAREGEAWRCTRDVAPLEIPRTLQGLLLGRLDRLPPTARRLLQVAAVLGSSFDLAWLWAAAGRVDDAALNLLREAELLELEPDGSPPRCRFLHVLIQEAVYQNLLARRRVELHHRAGRGLEAACGGRPSRLEELEALGHHFSLGGDPARGARFLLAAGDWARAVYANDEALRHYRRALATLEAAEAEACARAPVHERLGDLLGLQGQREEALERYEAARRVHAAHGDPRGEARLLRKMGGLCWTGGQRDRALACFQQGLELLEGLGEEIERAHLHQEMGRLACRSGDHRRAVEWAELALREAERLAAGAAGRPVDREAFAAVAEAANTLGIALARSGRLEEAVGYLERSVAVAEAHGLVQAACRGYTNLGLLYSTVDPGRAIATCTQGLELARKAGDLGFQSRLYANLAVAYCALTHRCEDQGLRAARTAVDLDRELGQLDHLAVPLIVLGQIYQCHGGDAERALACYREALGLAEQLGEPQLLFPCYDGLATLYLDLGDRPQAEHFMRRARQVCDEAGLDPDALTVLPFFC